MYSLSTSLYCLSQRWPRNASANANAEPLPAHYAAKECLNACCQGLEDLGKYCWLCLLSCSIPGECVAARRGPQTVSASLEAPEALTSWPQGADVHVIQETRWIVWIQTCVLYLPVWMQLVAKVWMEVEAFPGEEKEIQPRILENQPTNQTKPKAIIVPRNKITNISKFCMQLTSALMLEGGVNDLTI